ncbi:MAG: hypothetical protein LBQ98_05410 [Nitrososphaerota archaeon]|jgi:hypothetical protein|nr:hypothetical protein [Nitrososphaerota archaeon]
MSYNKKKNSFWLYAIAGLIIVLLAVGAVAVYLLQPVPVKPAIAGVKAGDVFYYSLQGRSVLGDEDAVEPEGFGQYNLTDYFKVAITDVNGSSVSLTTTWRFINGTEILQDEWIDLSNGNKTRETDGFWPIYGANLNLNDKLRPFGYDDLKVDVVDSVTYASGTRVRNGWSLQDQFVDMTDPSGSRIRTETNNVFFDKQTGMLDTLTNVQQYNSPQMNLVITWKLTNTNVWQV